MVMKPEVWSECLDELLGFSQPSGSPAPSGAPVLIFPNPSAPLFTQRDATELSHADHLLFGCGRYEATMRASRTTTAPKASTYANIRSATMC